LREAMPAPPAIDSLSHHFGLSPFERDIVLLCACAELRGVAAMRPSPESAESLRPTVTFGLALAKLASPHWSALTPARPLRLWRLIDLSDERAVTSSRIRIEERLLHYLVGVNYIDPRLRPYLHAHASPAPLGDSQAELINQVIATVEGHAGTSRLIQLSGEDPAGQIEVARRTAEHVGLSLHSLRAADIPANAQECQELSTLWVREARLLDSALFVQVDEADHATALRFASQVGGLTFVGSRKALSSDEDAAHFRIDRPKRSEQKRLWVEALGDTAQRLNGSLDAVAAQFRLNTDSITRAANSLRAKRGDASELESTLWSECRDSVRNRLTDLAQQISPVATWDDLVLPDPQLATLKLIVAHMRQRSKVYEEWGFARKTARGLGISVLFHGESGTGKTMAAEVLANELRLDLYRIDLASVVSKYIGETEKNLRRVFDAAEDSGAILLFDEADALFGKRSEVKDSHDRYANLEVSYLLQRMESYGGLAILTTNLKNALDSAFQRRLRFVVQFPFPDVELRERIWRCVFPQGTPLASMEYCRLAQLNVAGGNIRNIALNAAFLAAEMKTSIGMSHLLQAAHGEAAKRERPWSDAETRGWA
jgi:AAA+ superfamily predicted ATPase